jgi:hypothetical protein
LNAAKNIMAKLNLRLLSKCLGLTLMCVVAQSTLGFSVFGPAESWQVPTLDYVTRYYYPYPGGDSSEIGGPKNFNQGSRINTPIITYGYDITFLTYFGAKGVAAIDSAMNLLNGLPPSSSTVVSKYLMQGNQQINYTAQALELTDLKSIVLSIMMEHMGLNGETHTWDLGARDTLVGTCQFEYVVLGRNYDPVTYFPSSYVNGVNYYYQIWDGCSNGISVADAIEFPVDEANAAEVTYTAVSTLYGLQPGGYYLGLTYDDMGGLRYLYNKNNFAFEGLDSNSVASPLSAEGSWLGLSGGVTNAGTGTNFAGYLGGVEHITYIKMPTGTLLGGSAPPVRYSYKIPWLQNGKLIQLPVTRTVTQPDIIFGAGDLFSNNVGAAPFQYSAYTRGFAFITNGVNSLSEGAVLSQVISPQEIITFNDITPIYVNETPSYLDEFSALEYPGLLWGSFDGTTNAPTVYPNTSSLSQLIAQIFSGEPTGTTSGTWSGLSGLSTNAGTAGTGGATQ